MQGNLRNDQAELISARLGGVPETIEMESKPYDCGYLLMDKTKNPHKFVIRYLNLILKFQPGAA